MSLLLKPNPSSGVPIYVQLKEQIRHAVEIGVLGPGEPLPPIRSLAEQLVVNANTIARVYRELDAEGLLELRHGVGAFVSEFGTAARRLGDRVDSISSAQRDVRDLVSRLRADGLSVDAIRRLVDAELDKARTELGTGLNGAAPVTSPSRRAQ
jgi:GntR family transcriptional regulator